jgi:3-oxoacyl-[acyl-carrier protein] reductase
MSLRLRKETDMQLSFADKSVVVTGASRGIGLAIATSFAQAGASVAICARGKQGLDAAVAEIARCGAKVHADVCDLGDEASTVRFVTGAAAALGGIDVLVNSASGGGKGDDESAWSAGINVDLLGTVRATRAAVPFLEQSRGGAIVNISSIRGITGSVRLPSYAAVKAAIINYTISEALVLSNRRIRVNAIAPGSIEFPGGAWEKRKLEEPHLYEATVQRIPARRLGTAQEVANVALFLASDSASWVTGQVIAVDGGQIHT